MFSLIHKTHFPFFLRQSIILTYCHIFFPAYFNTAWRKQQPCSLKHTINISIKISQIYLKYGVEGGRKCFLTSCLSAKKKMISKDEVTMLFRCLNASPPTHNQQSISPFHWSRGPSTHSLSSLSWFHTFHSCFVPVSAATWTVKSPRMSSCLCSDHLWQMRVLCLQHVAPPSPCYHLPLSVVVGHVGVGC